MKSLLDRDLIKGNALDIIKSYQERLEILERMVWQSNAGDGSMTVAEGPDIDLVYNGGTAVVGRGGDTVLLFDSGGAPVAEYAATSAGLVAALAAATSGDVIYLPAGTISGDHTIPEHISVWGYGWNSILSGTITNNGIIMFCRITGTLTQGDKGAAFYMADVPSLGHDVQRTIRLSSEGYDPGTTIEVEGKGVDGTEGGAYFTARGKYEATIQLHCTDSTALKQLYRWISINDVLKAQLIDETTGLVIRDLLAIDDLGNMTVTGGISLHGYYWYDAKIDGGAVGDGITDDTTALQTLINTATANGTRSATIYFPPGTYLIGGALQDTGAGGFNGQIVLPEVASTDTQITIRLIGANRPPIAAHGPLPDQEYSVIKSSLTGASGTASCISGGNFTWTDYNNIEVVIQDLIFIAPNNPTFTMLNMASTQGGAYSGLIIATVSWTGSPTQPTNSNAYGLKLPGYGCANYTYVDGILIGAFYTGLLQGELAVVRGYCTGYCIVGVEIPNLAHASLIISMQQSGCTYGIKATGTTYCDILQYDAEHYTAPPWAVTVYDLDDASDYLHGHIHWMGVAVGGALDHLFTVNGAANASYHEIGAEEVTLDADASQIFDIENGVIGLDVQNANTVLAGPTTGAANEPTFRALALSNGDIDDVDITGDGQGDILYHNAGTYEDYPLGVGIDIVNDGSSIKIGNIADGNFIQIDTDTGEIALAGEATAWDDLRVEPTVRAAAGAGVPSFEKYFDDIAGTSKGVYLYSFTDEAVAGNEKEIFFTMQMPHSWKVGTDIIFHVHFVPSATVNSSDIIWGLEYTWKAIGEVFGDTVIVYSSTTLMPDDANITVGKHYIAEFSDLTPGSTASGLSSILIGRLFRNSSAAGDTYTNKVGLLYMDAHFQVDSFGSFDEYVKEMDSSLLIETGDVLLLESGDALLME